MAIKQVITSLSALFLAYGCHEVIKPETVSPRDEKRELVTVIEHDYSKHDTGLKCENVAKVTSYDFDIYACEKNLDQKLIQEFELIADVKRFGKENLGLVVTDNYSIYKDAKNDIPKKIYWLLITEPFKIPKEYDFRHLEEECMHIGKTKRATLLQSYKDKLLDEYEHYKGEGKDVYRRVLTNFSNDTDIEPNFLKRNLVNKIRTILHEEFHRTVNCMKLNRNIEESAAELIGHVGTILYCKEKFGENSKQAKVAQLTFERNNEYSEAFNRMLYQLEKLYEKDMDNDVKLKKKKEIFDFYRYFGQNNSSLWGALPYEKNFHHFYKAYKKNPEIKKVKEILYNLPSEEEEAIKYVKGYYLSK